MSVLCVFPWQAQYSTFSCIVMYLFMETFIPFPPLSSPVISSGVLNWFSNFFIFSTKPSCPQEFLTFPVKSIEMKECMIKFIKLNVEQVVFFLCFISFFLLSPQTDCPLTKFTLFLCDIVLCFLLSFPYFYSILCQPLFPVALSSSVIISSPFSFSGCLAPSSWCPFSALKEHRSIMPATHQSFSVVVSHYRVWNGPQFPHFSHNNAFGFEGFNPS